MSEGMNVKEAFESEKLKLWLGHRNKARGRGEGEGPLGHYGSDVQTRGKQGCGPLQAPPLPG